MENEQNELQEKPDDVDTNKESDHVTEVHNESGQDPERPEAGNQNVPEANLFRLDQAAFDKIKSHQNFFYALIGGGLAALLSAIIWAAVSIATKYQIGYMAIAVGLLVGFSVQFFGAGIDKKFGILGAVLSLLGCLTGNLFAQVGFIAQEYSYGYFETLSYLDFKMITEIMSDSFSPMDLFFYGIALFEGYKFSFRKITDEVIGDEGNSSGFKYRMPLVIISVIILSLVYIKVKMGVNGMKTFKYQSGQTQSKGELKHSLHNGKWTFYYENGNMSSTGYFNMDIRDSLWQWYDEEGKLESIGAYKNGLESGQWIKYYQNGNVWDSVAYIDGRMDGKYISRYENGALMSSGYYKQNQKDSIWESYYENGAPASVGKMKNGDCVGEWITYFENGKPSDEVFYDSNDHILVKNAWDTKGNQIVADGNGHYHSYSWPDGKVLVSGELNNGEKTGVWKTYSDKGKLTEEGVYENGIYKYINAWDSQGEQMIENGTGTYKLYYPDEKALLTTGDVKDGLKTGTWTSYYQSDKIMTEMEYVAGKQNGTHKYYFESGQIYLEGELVDDKMEGVWKWYNENGNLSSTVKFQNNKKEGTQIMYNEAGKKAKEEYYKDGELTGSKNFN